MHSFFTAYLTAVLAAVGALLMGPRALLDPDDALAAGIALTDGRR